MALQGTLDTFALPDVLRLLAATKKSGQLRIDGSRGVGSAWVTDGQVTAVTAGHAPLAVEPVDALFELLRFEDGSFTFDADAAPNGTDSSDVEELLDGAEALMDEWREIEAVVPSLTSFVTMRRELPDDITLDQARWTTLVAVGSGATVTAIGEALGLSELPVSRAVRDLVAVGAVDVEARAPEPVPAPPDDAVAEESLPAAAEDEGDEAAPAETAPAVDQAAPASEGDGTSPIPGPKARRAPRRAAAPAEGGQSDMFVPLDLSALLQQGSYDAPPAAAGAASDVDLAAAFPGLADQQAEHAVDGDPGEVDEETAQQLANLSPQAAEAVRAAAAAATDDEREAALAAVDDEDEPLNRGLLLKFLSSVKG